MRARHSRSVGLVRALPEAGFCLRHARGEHLLAALPSLLSSDFEALLAVDDDAPAADRFQKFLALLGLKSFDTETAWQELLKQDDVWLKAATLWEIGFRGLRDFRGELQHYLNSTEPVLKETAALVMSRI